MIIFLNLTFCALRLTVVYSANLGGILVTHLPVKQNFVHVVRGEGGKRR